MVNMAGNPQVLAIAITVFVAFSLLFQVGCLAQTDQTQSKLQAADTAVDQAFSAVSAAEKAGVNVTSLLIQLNNATRLLGQAENAYATGDNSTAISDANAVLPIANQVLTEAQTADSSASVSSQNNFELTIALTIVAAALFIVDLILSWDLFKDYYIKRLLKAKPKVDAQ